MTDVLLSEIASGVAVLSLHRPEARNALNGALLQQLRAAIAQADGDPAVEVIILTGSDPAFCAGLDLRELGSTGDLLRDAPPGPGYWEPTTKPVIGAVNGAAVTGGFELALQCDFLVASDRARFGDTHARVGVIPGGGMSALLPQAVGLRKAKEMSLTGRFLDASEALQWGLVTYVVEHDDLLDFTRELAADIISAQTAAVRTLLDEYRAGSLVAVGEALRLEVERFAAFTRIGFEPAEVARRRQAVTERGSQQVR